MCSNEVSEQGEPTKQDNQVLGLKNNLNPSLLLTDFSKGLSNNYQLGKPATGE